MSLYLKPVDLQSQKSMNTKSLMMLKEAEFYIRGLQQTLDNLDPCE